MTPALDPIQFLCLNVSAISNKFTLKLSETSGIGDFLSELRRIKVCAAQHLNDNFMSATTTIWTLKDFLFTELNVAILHHHKLCGGENETNSN